MKIEDISGHIRSISKATIMFGLSRKWVTVSVLVLIALTLGFFSLHHTVYIAKTCYASGSEPTSSGITQVLLLLLGSGGFSIASILAMLHKWADVIPSAPVKKIVLTLIDTARINEAKRIVDNSRSDVERQLALKMFDLTVADLRAEWFSKNPFDLPVNPAAGS